MGKHSPNHFRQYIEIHETIIDQFKVKDFIGDETLEFITMGFSYNLIGEIACRGNIVINVDKLIDVISGSGVNALLQTRWYAYNVFVRNRFNLFRYDNQDDYFLSLGQEHKDEHHKHLFDWETGEELPDSPIWVGEDSWPTLGEVIKETEQWYWSNRDQLEYPDSYPNLDLR
ncbi:unknown [Crocosphaera subtropica ATCC 51142]|uniref:Uncharacterized protein n=1 Tax=Crocosphaera subtropica (strain ATCC 51142 / BH68) TaxID=43989 RepID=B1X1U6_CROS5|nr:hypothetical protein [Crocosphaera subtropica]ACB53126.1 unknown [Crocosphaera subtropica ATCC 51142]